MNATVECPHCHTLAPPQAFCTSCGNALPAAVPTRPRVVGSSELAATSAGRQLQTEEATKTARKASGALLAVAVLQILFGAILCASLPDAAPQKGIIMASVFGIGAVFFLLYLWARVQPFPAAIVGLVLFLTVHLLDAMADPTALGRGIIVKIIVVVVLANAIKAGAQHRRLARQEAA